MFLVLLLQPHCAPPTSSSAEMEAASPTPASAIRRWTATTPVTRWTAVSSQPSVLVTWKQHGWVQFEAVSLCLSSGHWLLQLLSPGGEGSDIPEVRVHHALLRPLMAVWWSQWLRRLLRWDELPRYVFHVKWLLYFNLYLNEAKWKVTTQIHLTKIITKHLSTF